MGVFFVPATGIAGDVIPFYWKTEYHLFFIKPGPTPGAPWWHISTPDFAVYKDWGEAIPCGSVDEQDLDVWTGSVIEHEGTFHIFYTGHNVGFPAKDMPDQVVLHAISPDLKTWTKDAGFALSPPGNHGYERSAWRDPHVFRDNDSGEFRMLVTARRAADAPVHNRGCVALLTSEDLKNWAVREPFWAPDLYDTHECPDLFQMGDWWYLVCSAYRGKWTTHYRMSRSLSGPWISPPVDTIDADAFYAAKTAGDGERRYVIGWVANREGDRDDAGFAWGGTIVAHELRQCDDGVLGVRMPDGVARRFSRNLDLSPRPLIGSWDTRGATCAVDSTSKLAIIDLGLLPQTCLIETTVTYESGTSGLGLLLRADSGFDDCYRLTIDSSRQRIVFLRDGDLPARRLFEQERPLALRPGEPVRLRVALEESIVVIYANDQVALSGRMHGLTKGRLGLFVSEGRAAFRSTSVRGLGS